MAAAHSSSNASTPAMRLGRAAARLWKNPPRLPRVGASAPPGSTQRALRRAGQALLGSFAAVFRRLALQISAVLYFAFALSFGTAGMKSWLAAHPGDWSHRTAGFACMSGATELELGAALLFLYFAVSSLARSARSRS